MLSELQLIAANVIFGKGRTTTSLVSRPYIVDVKRRHYIQYELFRGEWIEEREGDLDFSEAVVLDGDPTVLDGELFTSI
jgi:hypothetical protein